ncbi:MAG: ribosome maturation factor RimM [Acidobacteriota bacterium]
MSLNPVLLDPVLVGRVIKPWGISGEVVVEPITENAARFEAGAQLWLGEAMTVVIHARPAGDRWVVLFEGINDRTDADALRGAELMVESSSLLVLEDDRYYVHDLIGCRLESPDGTFLGTVAAVVPGARDCLEVETRGRRALVPMARAFLRAVDMVGRRIVLEPPEGLLETTSIPQPARKGGR